MPSTDGGYRDRKIGLIVLGILEVLLGGLCLLLVPVLLLGNAVAAQQGTAKAAPMAILPALGIYAMAGTICITLGLGSILARRWARALWVCLSGVGLVMGVLAVPFALYATVVGLPRALAANGQPSMPAVAQLAAVVVMIGFMLIFYLVLPAVLFLFYRSPHVRRTCEARDPQERWTDRCPLPVLALSLFTGLGAFMVLFLLGQRSPFPAFGVFVTGSAGAILIVAYSAVMLYAAMGLYHLRASAWWILLAVTLVAGISWMITLWRADLPALYLQMGLTPEMASQAGDMARMFKWAGPVMFLPWLAWLLYVRRYFPRPGAGQTAEASD